MGRLLLAAIFVLSGFVIAQYRRDGHTLHPAHATRDTGAALGLRLMAAMHRVVLLRMAPDLALYYPSVGGRWEPEGGWRAFTDLLEREPEAVGAWLDRPPRKVGARRHSQARRAWPQAT